MGCARISVCVLISYILGVRARRTANALAIFSIFWTASGMAVAAIPCTPPNTSRIFGQQCIDTVTFANYIGASSLISELLLVVIPLAMWDIVHSKQQMYTLSGVFLARLRYVYPVLPQAVLCHFIEQGVTCVKYRKAALIFFPPQRGRSPLRPSRHAQSALPDERFHI